MQQTIRELTDFIRRSPTAFHAVAEISRILTMDGYQELQEHSRWEVTPGGKYFVTRNGSSIIAVQVGESPEDHAFRIAASHSDSPTFKVKEQAELEVRGKYMQLNTEGYGGMLCSTWFDRPLSVAGRIVVREGEGLTTKLVDMERDLVLIPSVAIHMNRKANEGVALNGQVDMLPLFGGADTEKGDFKRLIAEQAGARPQAIYGSDLYLYNRMAPSLWGAKEEFLSAPRLDDLQCAYATLEGFRRAKHPGGVNVYACFDNEEVGSGTKQGAASTFLADVLMRLNAALGRSQEDYYRAVADSFMVSADNAHAVHPNHPEKTDPENCVYMNEGIVIKSHAGQKYTSDAVSAARFRMICERADVPVQFFSNRSDAAGGSTLGNIAMGQVSMDCVDIGLPQLAMHSAYETAGVKDTEYLIRAMEEFFSA